MRGLFGFLYSLEFMKVSMYKVRIFVPMETKNDNPGVKIPPPLIYAATFFLSIALQNFFPISKSFFDSAIVSVIGWICIVGSFLFSFPAIIKFFQTKNTLITIKPANSLQSTGIYSVSRNPMYMGLALLYTGFGFLLGNWWTFVLIPELILFVTNYIIKREERYLERAFGQSYINYQLAVRRWF